MADYIVVPGKIDIFVACNFAWSVGGNAVTVGTPMKLGESADEIHIAMQQTNYPVPGDRNGGRHGDPIEEQFMSMVANCNLELSVFDPEVANALLTAGGVMATPGTIPQAAIGAFLRRDRSYRFTFRSTLDTTRSRNFPCTVVHQGHVLGGGSKFEMFRASISMHRAPPGHWSAPNVFYDTSMTGIPALP